MKLTNELLEVIAEVLDKCPSDFGLKDTQHYCEDIECAVCWKGSIRDKLTE